MSGLESDWLTKLRDSHTFYDRSFIYRPKTPKTIDWFLNLRLVQIYAGSNSEWLDSEERYFRRYWSGISIGRFEIEISL